VGNSNLLVSQKAANKKTGDARRTQEKTGTVVDMRRKAEKIEQKYYQKRRDEKKRETRRGSNRRKVVKKNKIRSLGYVCVRGTAKGCAFESGEKIKPKSWKRS